MILTLTANFDLPDAPAGYGWQLSLVSPDLSVVRLTCDGAMPAWIQRFDGGKAAVYTFDRLPIDGSRFDDTHKAALALFAALGLEVQL